MILDATGIPVPPPKDVYSDKRMVIPTHRGSSEYSERPPEYSPYTGPSTEQRSALNGGPLTQSNLVLHNPTSPAPTADQVHIFERHHNISGTFFIDPSVKAYERRKGRNKSKKDQPHASFRSRKGSIELELATTGEIQKTPKANISASTRSGNIKITLLPMPPSRPRMGLDVRSQHGEVVLFLPEGFSGVVHLRTKKGDVKVLPKLNAAIKIVKSSERETIFMMGVQNNVYELDNTREASFCEVDTRHGDVVVGLSGRDCYSPPVGFWKRLGGFLRGSSSTSVDKVDNMEN